MIAVALVLLGLAYWAGFAVAWLVVLVRSREGRRCRNSVAYWLLVVVSAIVVAPSPTLFAWYSAPMATVAMMPFLLVARVLGVGE